MSEDVNTITRLQAITLINDSIEKSFEKLKLHGDSQIQKSIKEWKNGERAIMFADIAETTAGETRQKDHKVNYYVIKKIS